MFIEVYSTLTLYYVFNQLGKIPESALNCHSIKTEQSKLVEFGLKGTVLIFLHSHCRSY